MRETLFLVLLPASIKATLLVILAGAVTFAARRRSAAFRHGIWASSLVALLALGPLVVTLPARPLPWLPASFAGQPGAHETAALGAAVLSSEAPGAELRPGRVGCLLSPVPNRTGDVATVVYLTGVGVVFGHLLLGLWGIWRIDRKARPWHDCPVIAPGVRVVLSSRLEAPLTWGWWRPSILLPAAARQWPTDRVRAALAHEQAHVDRRDWLQLVIARASTALFWFHPLVWRTARLHRNEAERACDDRVLATGVAPGDYAQQLVAIAREAKRRQRIVSIRLASAMAAPSHLSQRVHAILEPSHRRSPMNRTLAAGIAVSATLFVLTIAPARLTHAAGSSSAGTGTPAANPTDPANGSDTVDPRSALGKLASHALLETVRGASVAHIEGLLTAGADPNFAREGDGTALIRACRAERPRVVELLLAAGADPNLGVTGDGSPLIAASAHGNAVLVETLLAAGADPGLGVERDGSPLIAAAARGHAEIVTRLLDAGAEVDQIVRYDETALIQAALRGRLESARLLLDAGADPNLAVTVQKRDGEWEIRSPWRQAERGGHEDVIELLERHGAHP